jgi:hypothetical protein
MRIMARRIISAAAPWIGALIAARSLKARSEVLLDAMRGQGDPIEVACLLLDEPPKDLLLLIGPQHALPHQLDDAIRLGAEPARDLARPVRIAAFEADVNVAGTIARRASAAPPIDSTSTINMLTESHAEHPWVQARATALGTIGPTGAQLE